MQAHINSSMAAGYPVNYENLFPSLADYPEPFHVPVKVNPNEAYRYHLAQGKDFYMFPGTHVPTPLDRVAEGHHPASGWHWSYQTMLAWAKEAEQNNSSDWRGSVVETMWDYARRYSYDQATSRGLGKRLYHNIFVPAPVYMASEDPNDNPWPKKFGYVLHKHPSGGYFYLCYGEHTHPDVNQVSLPADYGSSL